MADSDFSAPVLLYIKKTIRYTKDKCSTCRSYYHK